MEICLPYMNLMNWQRHGVHVLGDLRIGVVLRVRVRVRVGELLPIHTDTYIILQTVTG